MGVVYVPMTISLLGLSIISAFMLTQPIERKPIKLISIFLFGATIVFDTLDYVFFKVSPNIQLRIVFSTLFYIFEPLFIFSFMHDQKPAKKWIRYLLFVPMVLEVCIMIANVWTGWVFAISENDVLLRGPLNFFPHLISLCGLFYIIGSIIKNSYESRRFEAPLFIVILIIVLAFFLGEIFLGVRLYVWNVSALFVEIYLCTLFFRRLHRDRMTGLLNREHFENALKENVKIKQKFAVVFDLDNLKEINDTYGHFVGDKYISLAGEIVNENFCDIGYVYRIGGDEFAVIGAYFNPQMVQQRLENCSVMSKDAKVGMSYGFATAKKGEGILALYQNADKEMYQNKTQRKQDVLNEEKPVAETKDFKFAIDKNEKSK